MQSTLVTMYSDVGNSTKRNHNKRAAVDVQPPITDPKECVPTNDTKESCSEAPREFGTRSSGKEEREITAQHSKIPRRETRPAIDQPSTVDSGDEVRNGLTLEKMREIRVKDAILANLPFAPPNIKEAWRSSMVMDMEKEVSAYHQREKEKLVAELGNLTSGVCFSIEIVGEDRWISITAHFINDDYNLVKKLIGFKKLPDRELFKDNDPGYHKAVGNIVESCLSDWKLFKNKRVAATSTHRLVDLDKTRISTYPHRKVNLDWKYTLCFKSYLEEKILDRLKYVFLSENGRLIKLFQDVLQIYWRKRSFNQIAMEKRLPSINEAWLTGLPVDWAAKYGWSTGGLPIRWSVGTKDWECCCHLVKIFKYALSYKEVFSECALIKINGHPILEINPECIDWISLKEEVDYFDSINSIIDSLSNFENPTSNLYFQSCMKTNNRLKAMKRILGRMEESPQIFHVACVLDPRYKLKLFEYFYEKINRYNGQSIIKRTRKLIEVLIGLLEKGEVKFPNANTQDQQEDDPSSSSLNEDQQEDEDDQQEDSSSDCSIDEEPFSTISDGFYQYIRKQKTANRFELDLYLEEETIDDTGDTPFDLLGWWKENSLRYPSLSRLARNVLALPACVYNVEENLKLDLRVLEGASPELVEAAICSKDWILSDVQR